MTTPWRLTLTAALLGGCFPFTPTVSFVGKTCDPSLPLSGTSLPCPDGLSCIAGSCQLTDGGAPSSGTTGFAAGSGATSSGPGGGSGSSSSAGTAGGTSGGGSTGRTGTGSSSGGNAAATSGGASSGGSSGSLCGGVGQACCGGVGCNSGLACSAGICGCTVASCAPGCCDQQGCEVGTDVGACGGAGGACERCTGFQTCQSAACVACGGQSEACCADAGCNSGLACAGGSCGCSPTSCPDGCCDANGCELVESQLVCGAAGAPCGGCTPSQVCQSGCVTCGGAGQPCCLNGGGLPALCDSELTCNGASCVCTPSSCPDGCCDAAGCHTNELAPACGDGGNACIDCGTGATCSVDGSCCGGAGEACCANNSCVAGSSCLATSSACGAGTLCAPSAPTYYEQAGVAPTGLAMSGSAAAGINAGAIFWTVPTDPGFVRGSTTSQATLINEPLTYDIPEAIAISPDLTRLYWVEDTALYGCSLNSSYQCTTDPVGMTQVGTDPPGPLVIDPAGNNLYWTEGIPPSQSIRRCALGGSSFSCTTTTFYSSSNMNVFGLAVDSSHVYWTDNGTGTVNIASSSSGAITGVVDAVGTLEGLAINASHIFFGVLQDIYVAPIVGGANSTLVLGPPGGCVGSITVDNASVYWADVCLGTLNKVPLCGSPVQTLWNQNATGGLSDNVALAVDPTNVYWSDPSNGTVMSIGK